MTIHLLTRTETRPYQPPTMRAICGHKSEMKKEFSATLDKVTCEECKRLAGYEPNIWQSLDKMIKGN